MPGKYEYYAELAEKTAKKLTDSVESWTSFLTTAARLYKYPYHEQLMIYAQRPDATACADYETWNKRMGRYVRRGSTGIALLDDTGNYPKLRYVFDVSDTGAREKSRDLNLWAYTPEHAEAVRDMLTESFFPHSGDLFSHIEAVSANLAAEYWHDHSYDIGGILADSFLEEYNIDTLEYLYRSMAALGTTYSILSRCGINPDLYIDSEDFRPIFEFNTPDTIAALGTAVSDMSEIVLREIERTVKNYERTHKHEEERTDLHESGRVQPPEPDLAESADAGTRQVRQDASELPERTPPDSLQSPDFVGEAVLPSDGDRPDGEPEIGTADERTDESERSDGTDEIGEPDALGADDEQPEIAGRGDDSDRADLQLTRGEQLSLFDELFPSEAEQIESIEKAGSEQKALSAFSIAQNEIDIVLKYGGNERDSRMRIAAEFMKDKSAEDHAAFMQNLFHGGNGFKVDGREICAWYEEDGIHLAQGRSARYVQSAQIISWTDAAARVGELLEQGQFASNVELTEAAGHERQLLAQKLCYLHQDMSEEARKSYFAESMFQGAFYDARDRIAEMLADPMKSEALTDELARFSVDFAADHTLLRFNFHKPDELVRDFRELALMNREFTSVIAELPAIEQFITEDEINETFVYHGSGYENGKQRIYDYFTADHTQKEKADFLKNEYGIGGHSHALSHATGSDEWHDGKGIRLKKDDCYDVQISWQNAVKRIDDLIRQGRYYTPEVKREPEKADTIPENFRITDDNLGEGGAKTKFRMNMDAIYTLKTLENEHRNATPDEQETLSRYVGWGGLAEAFDEDNSSWTREYKELKAALTEDEYAAARASTLNAHYTSPTVIKAIYEAVGNMGFTTGNILEPSMGVGNFFGFLPQEMSGSRLYGVELDSITGRIAKQLYPKADITVAGFETTDRRDFFDLAVGNVPFSNYKVNDKAYNKLNFSIHDYFFGATRS